jgi:hypothetical protein
MKEHLVQMCKQLDAGIGKINQREVKIISRTLVSPEQPVFSRAERRVIEQTLISGETKKNK